MSFELIEIKSYNYRKNKLNWIRILASTLIILLVCLFSIYTSMKSKEIKCKNSLMSLAYNEEVVEKVMLGEENTEEVIQIKSAIPKLTEAARERFKGIYHSEEKVAYLTFDDGPSSTVTPFILDVLKENNIKATFFTLGNNVNAYPDIVKREYEEGHYVANHGYSHIYRSIYASVQNGIDEFEATETAIQNALGIPEYRTHLVRFPGGSKGNRYERIISEIANVLDANGTLYLDWNCLTGDSAGKNDKNALMNEFINTSIR